MDQRSHYEYGQHQRSWYGTFCQWVAAIGTIVLIWFCFTATFNRVYKPYMKFWDHRADLVEQSRAYLTDPEGLCVSNNKAPLRVKIPEYDHCKLAQKRLESSPAFDAFADLMGHLGACSEEHCMEFSVNIISYIGYVIVGGGLLTTLVLFCVGTTVFSFFYRNLQERHELPTVVNRMQNALMMMHQQQQLQAEVSKYQLNVAPTAARSGYDYTPMQSSPYTPMSNDDYPPMSAEKRRGRKEFDE